MTPAFATLFAAGGVALEGFTARRGGGGCGPPSSRSSVLIAALPAPRPADPARRGAARLPGVARPRRCPRPRRPTPAPRCPTTSPGSSAGRRWWPRWRRPTTRCRRRSRPGSPSSATTTASPGADRPARAEVRPADEGPRHAPELLALGARRPVEGRASSSSATDRRGLKRWCGDVQVAAELLHPLDRRVGEQAGARLPPAADAPRGRSGRKSRALGLVHDEGLVVERGAVRLR